MPFPRIEKTNPFWIQPKPTGNPSATLLTELPLRFECTACLERPEFKRLKIRSKIRVIDFHVALGQANLSDKSVRAGLTGGRPREVENVS